MKADLLKSIGKRISSAHSIVILPHQSVDGDALGSALALGLGLISLGKECDVLIDEAIPKMLDYLPGLGLVKTGPGLVKTGPGIVKTGPELVTSEAAKRYDVAINIDNGDLNRLGKRERVYWDASCRLSLDHHATNRVEADITLVDTGAAATGEIVFELLRVMGIPVDKEIAMCLYTAILTDTGGFRFSNTTPETHRIAATLMSHGIDCGYAAKRVFDTVSMAKISLMKRVMNHLQLFEEGLLAVSFLTPEDIQEVEGIQDDFEGMVNIGRNIEGVEVSLFVREETSGKLKGSLRSNECVDVAAIAETIGGGGHKRAAGFAMDGNLQEVVEILRQRIIEAIRQCELKGGSA